MNKYAHSFIVVVVFLLTLIFVSSSLAEQIGGVQQNPSDENQRRLPRVHSHTLARGLVSFASLAKEVAPAVVNIDVVKRSSLPMSRRRSLEGTGSGFIIEPSGYIVTNNHVVSGAEKLRVRLLDRREFDAVVVGTDQKTDLALIKIEATELPFLKFGDSDALRVGDWVIAIGNPFGLTHTVTAGIVSAKGRTLGAGPYDDFIQTDASINPGNSGGPLVNIQGEVVGINTLINASGQGIGFAIPSNLAKAIIKQLREKGRVERAWLGAYFQTVTSEMASDLGMEIPSGALVSQIVQRSPAAEGGLQPGDVILEFGGREVRESREIPIILAYTEVGSTVDLVVLRNGKKKELKVTLESISENSARLTPPEENDDPMETNQILGMQLEDVGLGRGAHIIAVAPDGAAARAGLAPGDEILQVNQTMVRSAADVIELISTTPEGSRLLLLVKRNSRSIWIPMAR